MVGCRNFSPRSSEDVEGWCGRQKARGPERTKEDRKETHGNRMAMSLGGMNSLPDRKGRGHPAFAEIIVSDGEPAQSLCQRNALNEKSAIVMALQMENVVP